MKCPKCGADNPDSSKFCYSCGVEMAKAAKQAPKASGQVQKAVAQNNSGSVGLEKRNIAIYVLLSMITCGIFGLYWIYKINEDVNRISHHEEDTSGGLVILFSLITCGVYNCYWGYKIGSKLKEYYLNNKSMLGTELPVLFLVLLATNFIACGFSSLVAYCLMQDKLNKIAQA